MRNQENKLRVIKLWKENNPNKQILYNIKSIAKRRNIEFNLTHDDIVIPALCPVLGIPLLSTGKQITENTPTVDRIDPAKGYIKGNVKIISLRANRLKNDGSANEHLLIAEYMIRELPR